MRWTGPILYARPINRNSKLARFVWQKFLPDDAESRRMHLERESLLGASRRGPATGMRGAATASCARGNSRVTNALVIPATADGIRAPYHTVWYGLPGFALLDGHHRLHLWAHFRHHRTGRSDRPRRCAGTVKNGPQIEKALRNCAATVVPPAGFEPAAFCSGGRRSIP